MGIREIAVRLTGDTYPIENILREEGVRKALGKYIHVYPDFSSSKAVRPRICGIEDKIVPYGYFIDYKKVKKVIEEALDSLRNRPIEDFISRL